MLGDPVDYFRTVVKAHKDPVWFAENVVGVKLFPKQAEILREFYEGGYKKLIWISGMRCLTADTKVLTPDGYKRMTHCIVARNPVGRDARCKLYYNGVRPVWKVETERGFSVRATWNHPVWTRDGWRLVWQLGEGIEVGTVDGWDVVERIKYVGWRPVYDLGIEDDTHAFVANGMIVHNSGKSTLAALIAVYEFFKLITLSNPAEHFGLLKNDPIFISIVAVSEEQAMDTVFAKAKAMVEDSQWLQDHFDVKVRESKIMCDVKNVTIRTISSWSTTAVGRSNKAVIFDELANFEETVSKRGAWEIWSRLTKSTDTFGKEGKIVAISSPRHPNDIIMTLYRRALQDPEEQKQTLALLTPTWEVNPNISREELLKAHKHDLATFLRDFACQPQATNALQFPEGVNLDLPYNVLADPQYVDREHLRVMAIDPAVRNDAFGVAVGYKVGDDIYIDGAWRFQRMDRAYISPREVKQWMEDAISRLNVAVLVFDTWMFPELIEWAEQDLGLVVEKHIVTKKDYDRWRELQQAGRLHVCQYDVLKMEAESLLVINERKVDHPVGGSKDVADCVANVIWYLETKDTLIKPRIMVVKVI